ncbi:MAG: serine hydrolase, partial [Ferruginibacter sp.]
AAKYEYVLDYTKPIDLNNLTNDLNSEVPEMTRLVAENAITLLSGKEKDFLSINKKEKIAYVGFGSDSASAIAMRLKNNYNGDTYFFTIAKNNPASVKQVLESLNKYDKVIVGIHNINRPPLNNFGISQQTVEIINQIESKNKSIILLFGNAYAAKNWCDASNLIVCYEDGSIIQNTALDMLESRIPFKGTLPVSVCKKFGSGYGINTEHLKKKKHH